MQINVKYINETGCLIRNISRWKSASIGKLIVVFPRLLREITFIAV